MRVLNVLRHWVSKHSQDFDADPELKKGVKDLLEEMVCNTCLLPTEHKAAASILRVLTKEEEGGKVKVDLHELLKTPEVYNLNHIYAIDLAFMFRLYDS